MKKIMMLALTGLFLVLFVLVLQEREKSRLQMEGLFRSTSDLVAATPEKAALQISQKEETLVPVPESSVVAVTGTTEKSAASRNEEIKRALRIRPKSASRAEVRKLLTRYREEGKATRKYRVEKGVYDRAGYGSGWVGEGHEEDDDD